MTIEFETVIKIENVGHFIPVGDSWNGFQKWERINNDHDYFIAYDGTNDVIMSNVFAHIFGGETTLNIMVASRRISELLQESKKEN